METDRIHKNVSGCLALVAGRESDLFSMEEVMSEVFQQIDAVRLRLEGHHRDMQDIEFTGVHGPAEQAVHAADPDR